MQKSRCKTIMVSLNILPIYSINVFIGCTLQTEHFIRLIRCNISIELSLFCRCEFIFTKNSNEML